MAGLVLRILFAWCVDLLLLTFPSLHPLVFHAFRDVLSLFISQFA